MRGASEEARTGKKNMLERLVREEKPVPLLNTASNLTSADLLTNVLLEILKERGWDRLCSL
jgi:hypothetical protein